MATPEKKPFTWSRDHDFPPMYTLQPNATTRAAQLARWSDLVLRYAAHHRLFKLSLATTPPPATTDPSSTSPADAAAHAETIFANARISRRLDPAARREVLAHMQAQHRAEPYLTPGAGGGSGGAGEAEVFWIHWRTADEWAGLLEEWVGSTGQKGGVLTLYEMTEGEGARGTEFAGLDSEVLLRALGVLVRARKAQLFGEEGSQGVKFF